MVPIITRTKRRHRAEEWSERPLISWPLKAPCREEAAGRDWEIKALQPGCDLAACSLQALSEQQLVLDPSVQEAPSGRALIKERWGGQQRQTHGSEIRRASLWAEKAYFIVLSEDIAALQLPPWRKLQLRVPFSSHLHLHPRLALRPLQVGISSINRHQQRQPFKHGH